MGELFLYKEDGTEKIVGIPDYSYFTDKENEFELIEEQEEIDIQSIQDLRFDGEFDTSSTIKKHFDKINELIQVIKQIDKKIKEM